MLCYMDFSVHTGFASVAHNLLDRLLVWFNEKNVNVHICATNFTGKPFWYNGKNGGKAYVRSAKDHAKNLNDLWYRDGMLKMLNEGNWDLFWAINDIPVFSPTMNILHDIKHIYKEKNKQKKFKAVLYAPIDSPVNPTFMNDLDFWHTLVTYTNYGAEQLQPYRKNVTVIPHGANRNDFYAIDNFDKEAIRSKWKLSKDKFIFGNINKNNSRKNIGGTLLAFGMFVEWYHIKKRSNPEIKAPALYLHMSPTDSTGINLYRACEALEITQYVHYPTKEEYIKGGAYTLEEMNEIYNCLDCYITTTGAEGWGLTITEAMAVGLPIIAPMHTSISEITLDGKACYAVTELNNHFQIADYENIRHIPSVEETANQMIQAYMDAHNGIGVDKGLYNQILSEYDWDKIAETWKVVFSELL